MAYQCPTIPDARESLLSFPIRSYGHSYRESSYMRFSKLPILYLRSYLLQEKNSYFHNGQPHFARLRFLPNRDFNRD